MDTNLLNARRLTTDADTFCRHSSGPVEATLASALFHAADIADPQDRLTTLWEISAVLSARIATLHEEVAA